MSTTRDLPANPNASADQMRLLELLYGELDSDDVTSETKTTIAADDALAAELDAFTSIRQMMSELPDEEPPAALSAQLLHAAANQAPTSAKTAAAKTVAAGGLLAWLKRFFMPLAMHPAAAAAASLVLVVGLAGAIYLSGNWRVSEPTANSSDKRAAVRLDRSASAGSPREERFADEVQPTTKPAAVVRPGTAASPRGRLQATANQQPQHRQTVDSSKRLPPPPPRMARLSKKRKRTPVRAKSTADITPTDTESVTAKPPPTSELGLTESLNVQPKADPVSKANTKKVTTVTRDNTDADSRSNKAAQRLHNKARLAAKRGACGAVTKLGKQIRRVSTNYWSNNYRRDPKVRCRTASRRQADKKRAVEKPAVKVPVKK